VVAQAYARARLSPRAARTTGAMKVHHP